MMALRWVLYVVHYIAYRLYGVILFFGKPGTQTIVPLAALIYGVFYVRPEIHAMYPGGISIAYIKFPELWTSIALDIAMLLGWLVATLIFTLCSKFLGLVLGTFPLVLRPLPPTARLEATSNVVDVVVVKLAVPPLPAAGEVPIYADTDDDFVDASAARPRKQYVRIERWLSVAVRLPTCVMLLVIIKLVLEALFPALKQWGVVVYASQAAVIAVLWCYPRTLTAIGVILAPLPLLGAVFLAVDSFRFGNVSEASKVAMFAMLLLLVGLTFRRFFPSLLTVRTMAGVVLAPLALFVSSGNQHEVFPAMTYGSLADFADAMPLSRPSPPQQATAPAPPSQAPVAATGQVLRHEW